MRIIQLGFKDDSFDMLNWFDVSGTASTNGDEILFNNQVRGDVTYSGPITGVLCKAKSQLGTNLTLQINAANYTLPLSTSYQVFEFTSTLPSSPTTLAYFTGSDGSDTYSVDFLAFELGNELDIAGVSQSFIINRQIAQLQPPNYVDVIQLLGYVYPSTDFQTHNLSYSDVSWLLNTLSANIPVCVLATALATTGYLSDMTFERDAGWPIYEGRFTLIKGDASDFK